MQIFLTVLSKITLLFFLYAKIAYSSSHRRLQSDNDNPDSNLKTGEIALYPSSQYYLADVFIQNNASLPYLDGTYFSSQMILSLYMTETLMPSNCSSFMNESSYCSAFTCLNTTTSPQTLNLPYFQAIGDTASFNIYMDLNTTITTPSLITSSCIMGPKSSYGSQVFGIIGMGTAGLSPNSSATQYFSIFLTTNFLNNRLLFYFDPNKAQYPTPVATLQADANWHVNGATSIQIRNQTYNISNVTLVFDINSQAIFLPYDIYAVIIESVQEQFTCYDSENGNAFNTTDTTDSDTYDTSDTPFPICAYTYENIHALPLINITVGGQVLTLHPEIYVGTGTGLNRTILLNLITTNTSQFSQYYVTPTYQNTIILGANFMSYYYTLFDARNGTNTISIYLANHNPVFANNNSGTTSSPGSSDVTVIVLAIVCGVLLLICLIGAIWFCMNKKKQENINKEVGMVGLDNVLIARKQRQDNTPGINTSATYSEQSVL